MKILILEPHGDDALLSCHSILKTNNEIDILTLSERPSDGLKNYYKSINNVEFLGFPNLWYRNGKPILNTHQVHREFKEGLPISNNYVNKLIEIYGNEYYDDLNMVKTVIKDDYNNYDIVVCPIAVVHPYHVIVREAWKSINSEIPTLYYADKYYIQNRYAKEMYEDLVKSMKLDKEYNSGYNRLDKENKIISEILCSVYPSESQLLRFYSDIILWYPCKYAYKSNELVERLIGELYEC